MIKFYKKTGRAVPFKEWIDRRANRRMFDKYHRNEWLRPRQSKSSPFNPLIVDRYRLFPRNINDCYGQFYRVDDLFKQGCENRWIMFAAARAWFFWPFWWRRICHVLRRNRWTKCGLVIAERCPANHCLKNRFPHDCFKKWVSYSPLAWSPIHYSRSEWWNIWFLSTWRRQTAL